jgi:hypothetical protein
MSTQQSIAVRLKQALTEPTRGVLGLVDELLKAAREQEIHFSWRDGNCLIRIPSGEPAERIESPLAKSVARAVLARIAVICNEHGANSVSPYGGRAEIAVDQVDILVGFINIPYELALEPGPAATKSLRR